MINYQKGDLFKANFNVPNLIVVHSCNCIGVWGAGFAKILSKLCPIDYMNYQNVCACGEAKTGETLLMKSTNISMSIGCLFTSYDIGTEKDSESDILENTEKAILDLFVQLDSNRQSCYTIYSPKINSGLFKVPWAKTEAIIEKCLAKVQNIRWVVFEG